MVVVIEQSKQNPVAVSLASLAALLGFEAASFVLGLDQIGIFLWISLVVLVFLIVWQIFIFDLHLKGRSLRAKERAAAREVVGRFAYLRNWHHFLHFQNYLILPTIIYSMTIILLYLSPFDEFLKQVWIILGTLALGAAQWYMKTVFLAHREAKNLARQIIFLVKLYASYISFAAAFGISRYFGPLPADLSGVGYFTLGAPWFAVIVFCVSVLLLYQALFQHHYVGFKILKFVLATGFGLGVIGYVIYYFWNVNYYSGALLLTGIYNTAWGLMHHKYIDKNLTRTIVYEYLAVLFLILVMVIGTTNFAQRI